MEITSTCRALVAATMQWNVIMKSLVVSILAGTALTATLNGTALLHGSTLVWWKLFLYFTIPFVAEMLVSISTNFLHANTRVTEVILHEINQDQQATNELPEISVYSGTMEFGKDIALGMISADCPKKKFSEPMTSPGSRQPSWTLPTSPFTSPTTQPCYVRMHTNSMGMFPVDEDLLELHERSDEETLVQIRPLPKESVRKPFKNKSLGCVNDLHGKQRVRTANAERLHVFNNGLYGGDSPPHRYSPME